jgi:hypothetical protein
MIKSLRVLNSQGTSHSKPFLLSKTISTEHLLRPDPSCREFQAFSIFLPDTTALRPDPLYPLCQGRFELLFFLNFKIIEAVTSGDNTNMIKELRKYDFFRIDTIVIL